MPTLAEVLQTIEDYMRERDSEYEADQNRCPDQLHPDVHPYAMMTRTCYMEFDPLKARGKLPGCFSRDVGRFIRGYVILQDCKRNQIQVAVERRNNRIYLVQGWYRLKDFYGIHLGGWLTVLYISPTLFHIRVRKNTGIEVEYPDQTPPQRMLLNTPFGEGPSNGPVPLFPIPVVFSHRLEKTLISSDVDSGALTLFWKGFCENALPNKDAQLTLIDWLGQSWNCHLRVGNSPHITCQISGQWRDICKARRLAAGVVVKFGVTLPSNNTMIYLKISPFIGVRTTMIGPTRNNRRKPFYQTEHYFML